jgi:hypothetical protein
MTDAMFLGFVTLIALSFMILYSIVLMMSELNDSSFKRHRKSYLANKRKGR